ncbi:aminotransferase class IV [Candidatus Paracaedibacter symbiosus]|uniref:aminotransferase class IV n=1 Tax=Candidatus Paracaedibacter symbiosus TaxID=244582 RepID=UPI000509D09F|nr:aminotransferase class IV [Candidatus Paracaedibacter symbiosus]
MIVAINGSLVSLNEASVPINDRGLLLGDGVFETIYYDGQQGDSIFDELGVYNLDCFSTHWQRLQQGLSLFQIPLQLSERTVQQQILAVLAANDLSTQTAAVRLTVTRGLGERGLNIQAQQHPTWLIQTTPYTRPAFPVTLAFSKHSHPGRSSLSLVKHLGYQLNILGRLEAQAKGVDDVLFINSAGHVVGATAANLFAVIKGVVVTSPLSSGCLPGVKRGQVIQRLKNHNVTVNVRPLWPQEVLQADALFLTNSLIGVQSISRIEGQDLSI